MLTSIIVYLLACIHDRSYMEYINFILIAPYIYKSTQSRTRQSVLLKQKRVSACINHERSTLYIYGASKLKTCD